MKYTPDYYSDQLDTALVDNEKVDSSDVRGKIRHQMISYTAAAEMPIASVIALAKLPEKARIIGDSIRFSAYGAGVTLDLGLAGADGSGYISADNSTTADDEDLFLDGIDVSSAGADTFARLYEGDANAQYQTEKEVVLIATNKVAVIPAAATLKGEVFYVVD